MTSRWTKYRAVKREYQEILDELGVSQPPANRSSSSLSSGGCTGPGSDTIDEAHEPPKRAMTVPPKRAMTVPGHEGGSNANSSEQATSLELSDGEEHSATPSQEGCAREVEHPSGSSSCGDASENRQAGNGQLHSADASSDSSTVSEAQSAELHSSDVSSDTCTVSDAESAEERGPPFEPSLEGMASEVPSGSHVSAAEEFALIAAKHNMTHANINDVLSFCRRRGISGLPKDARTVMKTERKACLDQNDSFVHFGLEQGIRQAVGSGQVPSCIELQGNIDGIPLFKSSQTTFWPILCRVTNIKASTPFMVSVYCGTGKPPNCGNYLAPFLEEVHRLTANGMMLKGIHVSVILTSMVCDAPARSFVKAITGHTGYHACERCNQKGRYVAGRVTFPRLHAPLRTDSSFRSQDDEHHHNGVSPFTSLDVNMVKFFPTDYMHLVCLGVMRRLLKNWVCQGYGKRLSRLQRNQLNDSLRESAKAFPTYFQRKPRGTEELDRWKASEFRTFLLYVGPVVLKSILPDALYNHFLLLHVALRILVSPQHYRSHNQFAQDLLRYFVQEFGKLYGEKQLVYNVHTLIHLADQCLDHGPLDGFSAFPFESFLGKIKKKLRSSHKPLAQLSRRMSEIGQMSHISVSRVQQVKPGECFLLKEGPVVVMEVLEDSVKGEILENLRDFFKVPLRSSCLNIWKCDAVSHNAKTWPLADVRSDAQCLKLMYKRNHIVLPLLHLQ